MMRSGGLVSITLSDSLKDKNVKTNTDGAYQCSRTRVAPAPPGAGRWPNLIRRLRAYDV